MAEDDCRLCGKQDMLHDRRQALHRELRILAATSGCFDRLGLARLRASLAKLEGEEQALVRQLDALLAERTQLAQTRDEQNLLLRRNLCEQEKLNFILEDI
ncbi:MAG: hypothetical protein JHC61_06825 [Burkholderiaceae bacterium]|nr:hypothetical protein [Burkholderiaceae bacterium]